MGWARGSKVMTGLIKAVQSEHLSKAVRKRLYDRFIDVLEAHDWDTQDECVGLDPAFDEVFEEVYGER